MCEDVRRKKVASEERKVCISINVWKKERREEERRRKEERKKEGKKKQDRSGRRLALRKHAMGQRQH